MRKCSFIIFGDSFIYLQQMKRNPLYFSVGGGNIHLQLFQNDTGGSTCVRFCTGKRNVHKCARTVPILRQQERSYAVFNKIASAMCGSMAVDVL